MCYNLKTLLLRNDQTFKFISNNQTLLELDIHGYQTNICARLPLESWVEEIQWKRTTQFLFRDKRSFVHNLFLMVTTTPQGHELYYTTLLPKYDQTSIIIYFVIKLVFFHDFSEKFSVGGTYWNRTALFRDNIYIVQKLLLMITMYIFWDIFVFFCYYPPQRLHVI